MMVQYKSSSAMFFYNWEDLGHKVLPQQMSKVAFSATAEKALRLPFRTPPSFAGFAAVVENPSGKDTNESKAMITDWVKAINEPLVAKMVSDAVSYKLIDKDGSSAIAAALKGIIGDQFLVSDVKTQHIKDSMAPTLWGYGPTYVRYDFEPNFLASIRVVCSGAIKVVVADSAKAMEFVESNGKAMQLAGGQQITNPSTLTKLLQNMTEEVAKEMADKCLLYISVINEGEALYVPPGFLCGTAAVNSKIAAGLKLNILPKKIDTCPLVAIKKVTTEKHALQCLDVVLSCGGGD